VVRAVLEATLEELGATGYRALSMEAVALRAGVAKTTVYRRWPARADLVRAAFAESLQRHTVIPDTGSLRDDLVLYYGSLVKRLAHPTGRSLVRVTFAESDDPELAELVGQVRAERKKLPQSLIARAIARGEISPRIDASYLLDALGGVIHYRVGVLGQSIARRELVSLVDRTLAGALLARDD
jgi:AcrR family transcriptional regulator